jgi:hypothetical protein
MRLPKSTLGNFKYNFNYLGCFFVRLAAKFEIISNFKLAIFISTTLVYDIFF